MNKPAPEPLPNPADARPENPAGGTRLRRPLPPWLAEIEEHMRSGPTLWETLTEEDWEFFRNYDGPEVLGPPPPPPMKRRPRRRGED